MTDKRMSKERLAEIRDFQKPMWMFCEARGLSDTVSELLDHIDALRAELTAARTVADGEVASTIEELNYYTPGMLAPRSLMKQAADLLTRLSAAKEEAERERDSAREVIKELEKRRDQMAEWLQDNAPFVFSDQKHLDADTPERSYWHHGYMMALTDALALISQGEQ